MRLNDDKKADILITALEERYKAVHAIRERVQTIGIWVLGLLLAAGGWLIQSNVILTWPQKILAILGIATAFFILRFFYLEDLRKGFIGQQRTAVRLEKTLGFFTPKTFDDLNDPIYPLSWENAGTKKSDGKFFVNTYLLLYIGIVFLILAILLNGTNIKQDYYRPHRSSNFFIVK